ncbi:D-alanyl-D-alanine carboxypeptidase family protein [Streptomyces sp. NPDC002564]|uniref:D-alanyl-D-alanine carboxypeptidase family protein n=1 Tax=Streptomyces sp. NPDC002564 TaxID=3364649 RepID=UPI0036A60422
MGSHARPGRIHRTGARFATVALIGAVLPVTAGGLAQAATHQAPHSVDDSTPQDTRAVTPVGQPRAAQDATDTQDRTDPVARADHAFLLDARDGSQERELWAGAKADESVPMASTTKIMTALVVLRHPESLDRQVPVKQEYRDYVAKVGASTADLQTGDKLTVRQLLYAALIPSGADAARALADTFGTGDTVDARVADFVRQMNEEADQLGLKGTHFDSVDGISNGDNRSTARDMAKLGQRAMLLPVFQDVVKQRQFKTEAPAANGRTRYYTWVNTDQLLGTYDGALGIKTGSGPEAGYALVFAAKRDGRTLVGAVLATDKTRFEDATKILDWGFAH